MSAGWDSEGERWEAWFFRWGGMFSLFNNLATRSSCFYKVHEFEHRWIQQPQRSNNHLPFGALSLSIKSLGLFLGYTVLVWMWSNTHLLFSARDMCWFLSNFFFIFFFHVLIMHVFSCWRYLLTVDKCASGGEWRELECGSKTTILPRPGAFEGGQNFGTGWSNCIRGHTNWCYYPKNDTYRIR